MEERNRNFKEDVTIDPRALDVEWLEQPKLMLYYSQLLAQARKETDLAKENLDVTKARIDADVRRNPGKYTDGKLTETATVNLVTASDEVREAEREFIDAKENQAILQAAVNAIEAKKSALENLVRLLGQQYFAAPREPRDLPQEYSLRQQGETRQRDSARDKMRGAGERRGGRTR